MLNTVTDWERENADNDAHVACEACGAGGCLRMVCPCGAGSMLVSAITGDWICPKCIAAWDGPPEFTQGPCRTCGERVTLSYGYCADCSGADSRATQDEDDPRWNDHTDPVGVRVSR